MKVLQKRCNKYSDIYCIMCRMSIRFKRLEELDIRTFYSNSSAPIILIFRTAFLQGSAPTFLKAICFAHLIHRDIRRCTHQTTVSMPTSDCSLPLLLQFLLLFRRGQPQRKQLLLASFLIGLLSLVSLVIVSLAASLVTYTILPSSSQFCLAFRVLQPCSRCSTRSFRDTFLLQPQPATPPWTTPVANTLPTARSRYESCRYLSCKIGKARKALESIRHHSTHH